MSKDHVLGMNSNVPCLGPLNTPFSNPCMSHHISVFQFPVYEMEMITLPCLGER